MTACSRLFTFSDSYQVSNRMSWKQLLVQLAYGGVSLPHVRHVSREGKRKISEMTNLNDKVHKIQSNCRVLCRFLSLLAVRVGVICGAYHVKIFRHICLQCISFRACCETVNSFRTSFFVARPVVPMENLHLQLGLF